MIRFRGRSLHLRDDETVLDCLERSGEEVPASCRSGVCQTCLLRATSGPVPPESQKGLTRMQRERGYLLACSCRPLGDLELVLGDVLGEFESRVSRVERLGSNVARVFLEKPESLSFRAGQFLQVVRPGDGLTRPYSIASLPTSTEIELHIAVHQQGKMSSWLASATAQPVRLRGPLGECCYQPGYEERPLVLIGTGTGLAPLLGVLREAVERRHSAPITLYHGAGSVEGLYLWPELVELSERCSSLRLEGRVLQEPSQPVPHVAAGRIGPEVLPKGTELSNSELFLCGNPDLVRSLKRHAYLKGADLGSIHADPFVVAPGKTLGEPQAVGA